jgi:diaminohydroxyphosphoribosylaminopyrimidine deaminase/5-amino-6-(5-phosphoribosylamino)uracil reductase
MSESGADPGPFMEEALRLARRGRGRTSPNPMVGAVIARGSEVVGRGAYLGRENPHAEVVALDEAGVKARGATIYVTLEPCVHHGRTSPCTDAVVSSGVARLVAAMEDPDPRVSGSGFLDLRERGVEVTVGEGEERARALNRSYITHRRLGRPFVTLKSAITIDGRTAAVDGSSRWITGEKARRDAHRERAASDAVCVGVGTVLQDDPQLTAREVRVFAQPLRVVLDSAGRTPTTARVLDDSAATLVAVSTAHEDQARIERLVSAGADVVTLGGDAGRVSIPLLLKSLAERDVLSLMVEGGPTLAGSFVAEELVDRYLFYVGPQLMGSEGTRGLFEGWSAPSIKDARRLRVVSVRRLGKDLRIEALPEGR